MKFLLDFFTKKSRGSRGQSPLALPVEGWESRGQSPLAPPAAQVCETARFVKKFAFPQDSCRSPLAIFRFTLYTNKVYRKLSRKK
jgi:hypothetical protein